LARFPIPTKLTASANNYTRTANDDDHQNQFDVRVDGAFKSRDRSFGRYSYYNEVEQPVTPLPDGSGAITGTVIGTGGVAGLANDFPGAGARGTDAVAFAPLAGGTGYDLAAIAFGANRIAFHGSDVLSA